LFCVCIGYLCFSLYVGKIKQALDQHGRKDRWPKLYSTIVEISGINNYFKNIRVIFLSSVSWLLLALAFQIYISGFQDNIPWLAGAAVLAFVNLSSFVTFAPAHLGVFEVTGVLALGIFNVPFEHALVAVATLHLLVISAQIIYGLICQFYLFYVSRGIYSI